MAGNAKTDLSILGNTLSDSECYMDCSSNFNTEIDYLNSNNPKCGSQTTISIYQVQNNNISMQFRSDPYEAYGNYYFRIFNQRFYTNRNQIYQFLS